jgi:hypothetical protein
MRLTGHTYLSTALEPQKRREAVAVAEKLKEHAHRFEAIAVRGMSGALFGGLLAYILDKNIIVVRKKGDVNGQSHSTEIVEGHETRDDKTLRYLIVDDFTSSGETLRVIEETIGNKAVCVGHYLYRDYELEWVGGQRIDLSDQRPEPKPVAPASSPVTLPKVNDWDAYEPGVYYTPEKGWTVPNFLTAKVADDAASL